MVEETVNEIRGTYDGKYDGFFGGSSICEYRRRLWEEERQLALIHQIFEQTENNARSETK